MNMGQIKKIGKRTYCIIGWTDHDVTLQSMDEEKYIIVMPRTRVGGLKTGQKCLFYGLKCLVLKWSS